MTILEKRSWEERIFEIDVSQDLPAGVTLSGTPDLTAEPVTTPPLAFGGPVLNQDPVTYYDEISGQVDHVAPAGTVIQVLITGGAAPAPSNGVYGEQIYVIKPRCNTTAGEKLEATVKLRVKDSP